MNEIKNIKTVQNVVRAMKAAGQDDKLIVDRIINTSQLDDRAKEVFKRSKIAGLQTKAISDFISIPDELTGKKPLVQKEELETKGTLGTVGRIVGVEPLGRFLGAQAAKLSPEHRKTLETLKERGETEAAKELSRGGVSGRELAGSVIQTAGTLALPFAGKLLTGGGLGQRMLTSAGVQAGFGGAAAAAEGSTNEQIRNASLFGAAIGAVIPLGGLAYRGIKETIKGYPLSAYTKIFKDTVDDVSANLISKARGKAVNPILAEEMLQSSQTLGKTISGTADEMGVALAGLRDTFGKELSSIAATSKVKIPVGNRKNVITVLKSIKSGFSEALNPEKIKETNGFIRLMLKTKGKITADRALKLKIFIDNSRTSFRSNINLNAKQAAFKRIADHFRGQLHDLIPELGNKLKAYRITHEGFDMIVKEAVREGNQALINRLEAIAIGAGVALGQPAVASIGAGILRATRSPYYLTKSAQAVKKLTEGITKPRFLTGPIKENIEQAASVIGRRTLGEFGQF